MNGRQYILLVVTSVATSLLVQALWKAYEAKAQKPAGGGHLGPVVPGADSV